MTLTTINQKITDTLTLRFTRHGSKVTITFLKDADNLEQPGYLDRDDFKNFIDRLKLMYAIFKYWGKKRAAKKETT